MDGWATRGRRQRASQYTAPTCSGQCVLLLQLVAVFACPHALVLHRSVGGVGLVVTALLSLGDGNREPIDTSEAEKLLEMFARACLSTGINNENEQLAFIALLFVAPTTYSISGRTIIFYNLESSSSGRTGASCLLLSGFSLSAVVCLLFRLLYPFYFVVLFDGGPHVV
ncbi:unnamed protein product, partial [Laminaria digitata]